MPRTRAVSLAEKNLGLARMVAHEYTRVHPNIGYEEFYSVCCYALCKVAAKYDPTTGNRFSSYAVKFLRGECNHYLRDKSRAVRAPRRLHDLYIKGRKLEGTDTQIAEQLGVTEEQWREAKTANTIRMVECEERYHGSSPEPEIDMGSKLLPGVLAELKAKVEKLKPRDRQLLDQVFERRSGIKSPERIQQLQRILDELARAG